LVTDTTTPSFWQDENLPPAQRAYHPDEVRRSDGKLQIDVEWYLSQQILPPIARLCEPIEGTSQGMLSEQLGLDASKYARRAADELLDEGWGFTPRSKMDDSERFKSCAP
jgi:DNA polymerase alpha subunit A